MRADFSLARLVGHLIMGDGSGPDGLAEKDGAKALSGAESGDTATTQLDKPSRTELIPIKPLAATGSNAPGSGAGHRRVPSPDHGPLASTGGAGPARCGSA